MRAILCTMLVCVSLAGCHKNTATPTTPTANTPAAPTTTALSLSPATDLIKIKGTEKFTVTATLSDATTKVIQGAWGSDAPAVATAAADGTVTAVGSGDATVFADYQGLRATRRIHVVPDYNGQWAMAYLVTGCTETLDWRGICATEDTTQRFLMPTTFQQDRTTMTGQITPYTNVPAVPISGTINGAGHFTATGSVPYTDSNLPFLLEVTDFDIVSVDNVLATGHFTMRFSSEKFQGAETIVLDLLGNRQAVFSLSVSAGQHLPARSFGAGLPILLQRLP